MRKYPKKTTDDDDSIRICDGGCYSSAAGAGNSPCSCAISEVIRLPCCLSGWGCKGMGNRGTAPKLKVGTWRWLRGKTFQQEREREKQETIVRLRVILHAITNAWMNINFLGEPNLWETTKSLRIHKCI